MRWFTRDFVTGGLSDEEWNQRRSAYATHLNSIGAGLTDGAEELLASVHLHDGQVSEGTYRPGELLALTVLVGDLQLGYEWLTLRYRGASVVGATPADLSRWWSADAGTEIVEDGRRSRGRRWLRAPPPVVARRRVRGSVRFAQC
jgi:hypothetical protein